MKTFGDNESWNNVSAASIFNKKNIVSAQSFTRLSNLSPYYTEMMGPQQLHFKLLN